MRMYEWRGASVWVALWSQGWAHRPGSGCLSHAASSGSKAGSAAARYCHVPGGEWRIEGREGRDLLNDPPPLGAGRGRAGLARRLLGGSSKLDPTPLPSILEGASSSEVQEKSLKQTSEGRGGGQLAQGLAD